MINLNHGIVGKKTMKSMIESIVLVAYKCFFPFGSDSPGSVLMGVKDLSLHYFRSMGFPTELNGSSIVIKMVVED